MAVIQAAAFDSLEAAMDFVTYAHRKNYPYSGRVYFDVYDAQSGEKIQKTIVVDPQGVNIVDGKPSDEKITCTVVVEKSVLILMVTGVLDPAFAFMCGQVLVDDVVALGQFAHAFDFSREKLEQFRSELQSIAQSTGLAAGEEGEAANTANNSDSSSDSEWVEESSSEPSDDTDETASQEAASPTNPKENAPPMPATVADRTDEPIKRMLARNGMKLIRGLALLSKEVDAALQKLAASKKIQAAKAVLEEQKKKLTDTNAFKALEQHPATVKAREKLSKVVVAMQTKAKGAVGTLARTAYGPPVNATERDELRRKQKEEKRKRKEEERRAEKARLQEKIASLKEQNQKSEEERKQRIAAAVSAKKEKTELEKAALEKNREEKARVKAEQEKAKREALQQKVQALKAANAKAEEERKARIAHVVALRSPSPAAPEGNSVPSTSV